MFGSDEGENSPKENALTSPYLEKPSDGLSSLLGQILNPWHWNVIYNKT
jgi:hypothetical protein